ncbi:MAG: formylmethanofuran dehydrogenase subunit E family protein [Deltaproteobacteria bacterium]|nr:formylmethanofuran dehydrogenase subunit E family protein [Deltaproteobacteria bacterium]MBF0524493.1 formylmethanofuran dehydrogenase subunit E family protein [Deltaproteobacteria bacterium]
MEETPQTICETGPMICGRTWDQFLLDVENFHGYPAPGVILGGFLVDLALEELNPPGLYDVIVETRNCLPDAVQLLTPCTFGNGWLKEFATGRFAITVYDPETLLGARAFVDLTKLATFPLLNDWFLKLKTKQEISSPDLLRSMKQAHRAILSTQRVVLLSPMKKIKSGRLICRSCGESLPTQEAHVVDSAPGQAPAGGLCRVCAGESYYGVEE